MVLHVAEVSEEDEVCGHFFFRNRFLCHLVRFVKYKVRTGIADVCDGDKADFVGISVLKYNVVSAGGDVCEFHVISFCTERASLS